MNRIWIQTRPGDPVESLMVSRSYTNRQVTRALTRVAEFVALVLLLGGVSAAVMGAAIIAGGW